MRHSFTLFAALLLWSFVVVGAAVVVWTLGVSEFRIREISSKYTFKKKKKKKRDRKKKKTEKKRLALNRIRLFLLARAVWPDGIRVARVRGFRKVDETDTLPFGLGVA